MPIESMTFHWWYLVVLLLAFVLVFGFNQYLNIRHAYKIAMEMEAVMQPYEQHPSQPVKKILVAGDSTAYGLGATPEATLAGRLGLDYPTADIINIGHSGRRLATLREDLTSRKGERYDLVLLQIGANDITGRTSYEEVRKNLSEVLHLSEGLGEKVIILTSGDVGLAPVFRWPLSRYFTVRSRAVREIFMSESAKRSNVKYIDLFKERKDDVFLTDIEKYYSPDLFHPSGDGYGIWYEKVLLSKIDL